MSKRQKLIPDKRTQTIIDALNTYGISDIVKKYDYHLEGQVESSFSKEKIDFLIVNTSQIVCICGNKILYDDNKIVLISHAVHLSQTMR